MNSKQFLFDVNLSWNRDGQKLLSASTDNMVSVWDVLSGECDKTFRFPSPVIKVQFHPRDRYPQCCVFSSLKIHKCGLIEK